MKLSKSGSVDIKNDSEMAKFLYPSIRNDMEIDKREKNVSNEININIKRYNYKE
jgi:hypothetical protein